MQARISGSKIRIRGNLINRNLNSNALMVTNIFSGQEVKTVKKIKIVQLGSYEYILPETTTEIYRVKSVVTFIS